MSHFGAGAKVTLMSRSGVNDSGAKVIFNVEQWFRSQGYLNVEQWFRSQGNLAVEQ